MPSHRGTTGRSEPDASPPPDPWRKTKVKRATTIAAAAAPSWDALGDDSNVVLQLDLAAAIGLPSGSDVVIDGLGWDVTIETFGAPWISEATVGIDGDGDGTHDVFLNPSAGDDVSGFGTDASGRILDLGDDFGLADLLVPGGIVTPEAYGSFDDVADAVDSVRGGAFELNVIPGPGAGALLGLAGSRRHRG